MGVGTYDVENGNSDDDVSENDDYPRRHRVSSSPRTLNFVSLCFIHVSAHYRRGRAARLTSSTGNLSDEKQTGYWRMRPDNLWLGMAG
jgi:hypothetical protein